ncbi:MAG: hypothetical protein MJZ93_06560, partial [Paludibacteraceae bacterium]|nr:hypothetical protein [Paludibacteraceae bacterium]
MNRLTHSSGGNSDAGVLYDFQQIYSPSGRIGDKTCDFTHSDHLGSSSWTTDENGYAVQHIEYLPFGEEFVNQRLTPYEDRYTFTGKELDAESNLYYYDARYNSSTYSQFTSPDPMSDKYPSVSPYLYCAGNPIRFVDPTGMVWANLDEINGIKKELGKKIIRNKENITRYQNKLLSLDSNDKSYSKKYNKLNQQIHNLEEENIMIEQALSDIELLSEHEETYDIDCHLGNNHYVKCEKQAIKIYAGEDTGTILHEIAHIRQYITQSPDMLILDYKNNILC